MKQFFYLDFITAGIASVYQEWLLSDKKMSKDKLSKLISEVIVNGGKTFIKLCLSFSLKKFDKFLWF